jgi:catechol-2,3-dioxygenase
MASIRLAHYVLRTNQLAAMRDWYCTVLQARVNFGSDKIAFLSYDDEHHRVALVAIDRYAEKKKETTVGFYHAGFAFDTLGELLANYERLKALGVVPYRSINHGPTLSFYYRDPDGNDVETQVDTFPDAEATNAWMRSEAFAKNPIGVEFVPEELIAKHRAGVPDSVLLRRPDA